MKQQIRKSLQVAVTKGRIVLAIVCALAVTSHTPIVNAQMSNFDIRSIQRETTFYDPTCVIDPGSIDQPGDTQNLEDVIKKLASENGGGTAIAAAKVDDPDITNVNGSKQMPTRSSYKLYTAYATLRAVKSGKISWGTRVSRNASGENFSGTVEQAFEAMIVRSDNGAAGALRTDSRIGTPAQVTKMLQDSVKLSNKTVMGTGVAGDVEGSNSKSTANDFAKFLQKLNNRELPGLNKDTDKALYDKLLGHMRKATTDGISARQGIAAGVGGVAVADKPGWAAGESPASNDVGIVYLPGNRYVLAILTNKPSPEGWEYVKKIAEAVHEVMQQDLDKDASSDTRPTDASVDSSGAPPSKELVGDTPAEKAYNYLTGRGLSGMAAAGIVGNLMQESGGGTEELNPRATNGSHTGIAQWDNVNRFSKLREFAADRNKDPFDLKLQLDYLWHELRTGYKGALAELRKAKTADKAAVVFLQEFERSGEGPGSVGYNNRIRFAKDLLDKYGDGESVAIDTGAQANGGCTCEDPTAVDNVAAGPVTPDMESFIERYGQTTFNVGKKYGIPYDAILAQAGQESVWGKFTPPNSNNLFGIKAYPGWTGETVSAGTSEDTSGGMIRITAAFIKFNSVEEGIEGYAQFIHRNSRYATALKYPRNPVRYIQEIKKAGYATDRNYVTNVTRMLKAVQKHIKERNLFPPSSEVQPDSSPDGGDLSNDTSAVQTADCSAGAVGGDAVATALTYAWPEYHAPNYFELKPEYKKAIELAMSKGKYVGGGQYPGVDCGGFITRVMQDSGADPQYGGGGNTISQQQHMKTSGKYQEFKPDSSADLKPGDIAINSGHTFMFVGEQDGFETQVASASYSRTGVSWRSPMAGKENPMNPSYTWYRLK